MERVFFVIGALFALLGVAAGALGSHTLKSRMNAEMLSIFEVGVRYQMYHAFALIAAAWAQAKWPSRSGAAGGWLFVAGTILFSGSLYLLSVSSVRWFSAFTPVGGLAFMAGWVCIAWAAWRGCANR
jgi:uncharacterized membrane protein YgdD (TMEM256/DUF423 family)